MERHTKPRVLVFHTPLLFSSSVVCVSYLHTSKSLKFQNLLSDIMRACYVLAFFLSSFCAWKMVYSYLWVCVCVYIGQCQMCQFVCFTSTSWRGNIFIAVCLPVCLSVCLSVNKFKKAELMRQFDAVFTKQLLRPYWNWWPWFKSHSHSDFIFIWSI